MFVNNMLGWLLTNKYYISNSILDLKHLIIKSAYNKNIELIEYNNVDAYIALHKNTILPDFVLFWDKDIKLASYIESLGLRVFNSSESIRLCDDKALTYLKLSCYNIKQPKTIFSPLIYYHDITSDNEFIDYIMSSFKMPFIFKECFGSFGKQVYLVHDRNDLIQRIQSMGSWPYVLQEFIETSFGSDLRLYVVGGKIKAAMKRVNVNGDFRANIEQGSHGIPFEPTNKQVEMALKVTKILGLDFGGIDILFGKDDEPIFCEANSNAYFNEINRITGVHIEDCIFDYILQTISN